MHCRDGGCRDGDIEKSKRTRSIASPSLPPKALSTAPRRPCEGACEGACTYDVNKNFGFVAPPTLSLSLSHSRNLSVLSSAFGVPYPNVDIICTCPHVRHLSLCLSSFLFAISVLSSSFHYQRCGCFASLPPMSKKQTIQERGYSKSMRGKRNRVK